MKTDNRRRQYWIHPTFQGRYMFQILTLEVIVALATMLLTFLGAFVVASPGFTAGAGWQSILIAFLALLVVCAAALVWMGVRISHRICGPARRIQMDLKAIRQGGDIKPIRLRTNDELRELADEINRTIEYLNKSK